MAMDNGVVTIDDEGVASGTGLARDLYDSMVAVNIDPFASQLPAQTIIDAKKALAAQFANLVGPAVVNHVRTGDVSQTIETSDQIQRMSNPVVADALCQGPASQTALATFGTIN